MSKRRGARNPRCPSCGVGKAVPIFYGLPCREDMEDLLRAEGRGEVVLESCCVTGNEPRWACKECGHRWS